MLAKGNAMYNLMQPASGNCPTREIFHVPSSEALTWGDDGDADFLEMIKARLKGDLVTRVSGQAILQQAVTAHSIS